MRRGRCSRHSLFVMTIPPQAELRPYRVTENRPIAEGCFALTLEPADASRPVPPFQAGQWVGLHLLNTDGTEWARAAYSIAIAPHEYNGSIELGIKREGDFTARAESLLPGDMVNLQGPFGVFTPNMHAGRWMFFAGGIGIVPIRSMVRELAASGVRGDIILFYSSRKASAMPYAEEFRALAASHPHVRFVEICTGECPKGWKGERGRIGRKIIETYAGDVSCGEFLLCGPKGFMEDLTQTLNALGVDAGRIRRERFS
ncbi:hypothetical protein FBR07_02140 [Candidatus Uhrbacteria bacterium UHB]|nr:hypothetical protein [Candidatus Uhrbacteria bacterium UHB]RIL00678.1 MAG: hypothetical protein DCC77_04000 [Candidatus Uhrbacteria bacterium]